MEDGFRFESLVATICSSLANAEPQNIDERVRVALRQIAEAVGGNRVLLGQADEKTRELVARVQYRSTEPPFPQRLSIGELNPLLWRTMVAGEVANVPDVAALPEEGRVDREYFLKINLLSYVAVPVCVNGALRYMLAVGSVGVKVEWAVEAVPRLRVLAEVLASALMRCDAEREVRENEQLFRAFVEHAPVPIALIPGPDQAQLYFNPEFTRLFGYTREDLPELASWWQKAYPDPVYRAERWAGWERYVAASPETGWLQDSTEAEIRTRDGEVRYAQIRLATVRGYKLVFFSDLTEWRQAEAALRLTQYAVDHNPVIIFRIDKAGRFVYANETACQEFGYSPAELLTKNIWDISGIVSREDWPARSGTVMDQGDVTLESVYRRKDGETFPVEVHIHAMHFSGEGYFFCFALDASERRAAQEAAHSHLKRMQALAGELSRAEERQRRELATVLHDEIGQNLFAVTTQVLALQNRVESEKENLGKVLALLDRISQDTRELTFELCPPILYQIGLAPALQRLMDQMSRRHKVEIRLTGGGVGPPDLNVRGLAYHAVRELVNNAAKHAQAQHVWVDVREEGAGLRICVEDDGIGYDCDSHDRRNGFGLFHLSERIELLGGRVDIDAAVGQGCRVRIDLPLESPRTE
jgi:PAS domain S-box-containing protein